MNQYLLTFGNSGTLFQFYKVMMAACCRLKLLVLRRTKSWRESEGIGWGLHLKQSVLLNPAITSMQQLTEKEGRKDSWASLRSGLCLCENSLPPRRTLLELLTQRGGNNSNSSVGNRKHFTSGDIIWVRFVLFVFVLVLGFGVMYTKGHCCKQLANIRDLSIRLII